MPNETDAEVIRLKAPSRCLPVCHDFVVRAILDLDRWPLPVLIVVSILAVASNLPPLAPVSALHIAIAIIGGMGFGLSFWARYRQHRSARLPR